MNFFYLLDNITSHVGTATKLGTQRFHEDLSEDFRLEKKIRRFQKGEEANRYDGFVIFENLNE